MTAQDPRPEFATASECDAGRLEKAGVELAKNAETIRELTATSRHWLDETRRVEADNTALVLRNIEVERELSQGREFVGHCYREKAEVQDELAKNAETIRELRAELERGTAATNELGSVVSGKVLEIESLNGLLAYHRNRNAALRRTVNDISKRSAKDAKYAEVTKLRAEVSKKDSELASADAVREEMSALYTATNSQMSSVLERLEQEREKSSELLRTLERSSGASKYWREKYHDWAETHSGLCLDNATPDELAIIAGFAAKVMGEGRRQYGTLDLRSDKRSSAELAREGMDEFFDSCFYAGAAKIKKMHEDAKGGEDE